MTEEPDEQGKTARIEPPAPTPSAPTADPAPPPPELAFEEKQPTPTARVVDQPVDVVLRPAAPHQQDVVFVPLAVNIGDGFKFGCGFFLAMVLAMLIGFVLLAGLFVLTGLFGLNLPISR